MSTFLNDGVRFASPCLAKAKAMLARRASLIEAFDILFLDSVSADTFNFKE